ncbi:restriction endonuclease subunit S [Methanomethylophilus alvi]|uniref:restriction endonuclease subunit S n=1 Tax=Methanomethylophilus alvi TaxID=1291540 RepID=UPI0037DDAB24
MRWATIGSFSKCIAGATPKTSNASYWTNGSIPWMSFGEINNRVIYSTEKKITQEAYDSCSTKVVPANTVVIALAGQGKTRGNVAITKISLCTNQSLCSVIVNDDVYPNYLRHYLDSQYQRLREISSGDGTRGGLNLAMIRNLSVPIPRHEEQVRIAKCLDELSNLFENIFAELPVEIETRKKQYEFYRDKLLAFN